MFSNPATRRVLLIPELLEVILLQLDLQTILISCILVCRHWYAIIQKSPHLQRHLFLLSDAKACPALNPLLAQRFPHLFQHALSTNNNAYFTSLTEPVLTRCTNRFPELPWLWRSLAAYRYAGASWKRMLVCQPPVYAVGLVLTDHNLITLQAGLLQTGDREPLPITMMPLIRWSLQQVLLNRPSEPDVLAVSEFRVLWRQLPQDVTPPPAPFSRATEETGEQESPLYHDFDRLIKSCGIVLHINACLHCAGTMDARAGVLWDITLADNESDEDGRDSDPVDLD